jgi:hypothetical protein
MIRETKPVSNTIVDLDGPNGNAFMLLAIAESEMEGLGIDRDEIDVILDDIKSDDYNHLLKTMDEHLGANEDHPFGIIFETTNEELLEEVHPNPKPPTVSEKMQDELEPIDEPDLSSPE